MAKATAEHAVTLVQDLLREYKTLGLKQRDRFVAVARWFGITPRRVRAIRDNEAARIAEDEYQAMLSGWDRYWDERAARMAKQLKEIQARKAGR